MSRSAPRRTAPSSPPTAVLKYQAGAFAGLAGAAGLHDLLRHVRPEGRGDHRLRRGESNRPKVAAYRAPGAPISTFATESALDDLARKLEIDPIDLRLKNAAKDGTKAAYGPTFGQHRLRRDPGSGEEAPELPGEARAEPGARRRLGLLVQHRRRVLELRVHIAEDGTATVISGNPDIGGSRASMAMMAAEELGVDYGPEVPAGRSPIRASIGFTLRDRRQHASPSPPAWR